MHHGSTNNARKFLEIIGIRYSKQNVEICSSKVSSISLQQFWEIHVMHTRDYWKGLCESPRVSVSFCEFLPFSASFWEYLWVFATLWKLLFKHNFSLSILWAKIAHCEMILNLHFRMILQALQPQSRVSYFPWESSTFEFCCGLEKVWKTIVFLLSRK